MKVQALSNKNYNRGRAKEYSAMRILENAGFHCIRSSGSHGMWDIHAYSKVGARYIQVKLNCAPSALEREKIEGFDDLPTGATKEIWTFLEGKSVPIIEIIK